MPGGLTRFLRDDYSAQVVRIVRAAAIVLLVLAVCALVAFAIIWAVATYL